MHAALQQDQGTIGLNLGSMGWPLPVPGAVLRPAPVVNPLGLPVGDGRSAPHQGHLGHQGQFVSLLKPRRLFIRGITSQGQIFRPSDWAERLAGAMSSFRPAGSVGGIAAYIGYSPYCVPQLIEGVKCVLVSEALRDVEPMAWDFVMNFARDNELSVVDASGWTGDSPVAK
jgi:hypothetical protein